MNSWRQPPQPTLKLTRTQAGEFLVQLSGPQGTLSKICTADEIPRQVAEFLDTFEES